MRMRELMRIVETAGTRAENDFADHMTDACSATGVGFHFEEGGCWGMALALYDQFKAAGQHPQLVLGQINGRNSHAMVQVNGTVYDYSGATSWPGDLVPVSPEQLMLSAEEAGYDEDTVQADRDEAADIIQNAVELSVRK